MFEQTETALAAAASAPDMAWSADDDDQDVVLTNILLIRHDAGLVYRSWWVAGAAAVGIVGVAVSCAVAIWSTPTTSAPTITPVAAPSTSTEPPVSTVAAPATVTITERPTTTTAAVDPAAAQFLAKLHYFDGIQPTDPAGSVQLGQRACQLLAVNPSQNAATRQLQREDSTGQNWQRLSEIVVAANMALCPAVVSF